MDTSSPCSSGPDRALQSDSGNGPSSDAYGKSADTAHAFIFRLRALTNTVSLKHPHLFEKKSISQTFFKL